eukprot:4669888-Amphidinium_carterae.1
MNPAVDSFGSDVSYNSTGEDGWMYHGVHWYGPVEAPPVKNTFIHYEEDSPKSDAKASAFKAKSGPACGLRLSATDASSDEEHSADE